MADNDNKGPAVIVEDLSKAFRLPRENVSTLKERALHPLRRQSFDRLEALRDVSFNVEQGEFFGIVGRNGSGKSTMLKCLAGIYGKDQGRIYLRGRMATFIELGVGFNQELTARENVIINAIMLGLTPTEARQRYQAVVDFAELGEFEDLKLKNYSSGMFVRLAFATMIQVDADLLVIDEVLAVGDASFQAKCHDTLRDIRKRGRTILFVTHDMTTVENQCDRALLLERGDLREIGDPGEVARAYDRINFERVAAVDDDAARHGDGRMVVAEAWIEDAAGRRTTTLEHGVDCSVHVLARAGAEIEHPVVGFTFSNDNNGHIWATDSIHETRRSGLYAAGDELRISARFRLPLGPGRYSITPWVRAPGGQVCDLRERYVALTVLGQRGASGLIDIEHELTIERPGAVVAGAAGGDEA